jgi:hypothetical protein
MSSAVMMPSRNEPHPTRPSIFFSSAWINGDQDTVPDDHCKFGLTVFCAMRSSFPHSASHTASRARFTIREPHKRQRFRAAGGYSLQICLGSFARPCRLTTSPGRAPAPPAIEAGMGTENSEHDSKSCPAANPGWQLTKRAQARLFALR